MICIFDYIEFRYIDVPQQPFYLEGQVPWLPVCFPFQNWLTLKDKREKLENYVCKRQVIPPCPVPIPTHCPSTLWTLQCLKCQSKIPLLVKLMLLSMKKGRMHIFSILISAKFQVHCLKTTPYCGSTSKLFKPKCRNFVKNIFP